MQQTSCSLLFFTWLSILVYAIFKIKPVLDYATNSPPLVCLVSLHQFCTLRKERHNRRFKGYFVYLYDLLDHFQWSSCFGSLLISLFSFQYLRMLFSVTSSVFVHHKWSQTISLLEKRNPTLPV